VNLGPALPTHPLLAGVVLNIASESWEVRTRQAKVVHDLPSGRREAYAYVDPGRPEIHALRTFEIAWAHLRGEVGLRVGRILSRPGPHDLILWQVENCAYAGDGARTEFVSPWRLAVDVETPPGGLDPSRFHPEVRLAIDGAPLAYLSKSSTDYAAADPAADEVWWLTGGVDFKLESAPAAGTYLYLDVVPAYSVFDSAETSRSHKDPVRRPRTLTLLEGAVPV